VPFDKPGIGSVPFPELVEEQITRCDVLPLCMKRCAIKTIIKGLYFFLLLLAGVAARGQTPSATPASPPALSPDIQRIKDRGVLIVAMYYKDIPPFFMHLPAMPENARCIQYDADFFCGVDVELALNIADELGVSCEFHREAETFDEIIDVLMRHEADVAISVLSRTLQRSEKVLFSTPYLTLYTGMLLNRLALTGHQDDDSLKEILDAPNVVIGSKKGNSWIDYAKELFPRATIREYPNWDPDVIEAVRNGDVLAAYADEMEIKKVIIAKPAVAIELKTIIIKDIKDRIAIAVPWESSHLLAWLNLYLEENTSVSMSAENILKKYPESVKGAAEQEVKEAPQDDGTAPGE